MEENKTLKEYLRKFLEGYKYVVENRYNYQFSSNPEAFPFMRKDDYKISIFYLNQSFFEEPCIVVISNDSKLKEIYIIFVILISNICLNTLLHTYMILKSM